MENEVIEVAYFNNGDVRKARKPHKCYDCGRTIAPGEVYWEDYNETGAFTSGDRYCETCASKPTPSGRVALMDPALIAERKGGR